MSEEMNFNFDLDNFDFDGMTKKQIEEKNSSFVDPTFWSYDKKVGQTYIIRFLPDLYSKKNWINAFEHFVEHYPDGEKKFLKGYCIKNMDKMAKCDCCSYGWGLRKSGIEASEKRGKKFTPSMNYISNILVVSDPVHPENNGKVFKFKFGNGIMKLIEGKITPDDSTKNDPDFLAFNPFDPMKGADFKFIVTPTNGKKSYSVEYTNSAFRTSTTPVSTDKQEVARILKSCYNLDELAKNMTYLSNEDIRKEIGYLLNGGEMPETTIEESAHSVGGETGGKSTVTVDTTTNTTDKLNDKTMDFIKGL